MEDEGGACLSGEAAFLPSGLNLFIIPRKTGNSSSPGKRGKNLNEELSGNVDLRKKLTNPHIANGHRSGNLVR